VKSKWQHGNFEPCLKGTKTSDWALDQVFPRVVRPAARPVHGAGSGLSIERDTCFVNIVRRHRPPCLTSDRSRDPSAIRGTVSGFRPAERARGTPSQGHDRNTCTLQASRVASARRPLQTPQPVHQRLILIYGLEDFLGDVDANLERKHRDPACGCGPTHGELVPRTAPETLS
jgi:hypothetical protein